MKKFASLLTGIVTLSLLLLDSLPLLADSKAHFLVKTYNLEEMVAASERIFVGRLIETEEDYLDARGGIIPVTIYTFAVDEALEGAIGNTLTIRQVGHRSRRSNLFGPNTPQYKEGEVLMIFLAEESEIGLTSPIGLGQGAFRVKTDHGVKISVVNSRGNQGLLEGSARIDAYLRAKSAQTRQPLKIFDGDIPYASFRDLVLELLNP